MLQCLNCTTLPSSFVESVVQTVYFQLYFGSISFVACCKEEFAFIVLMFIFPYHRHFLEVLEDHKWCQNIKFTSSPQIESSHFSWFLKNVLWVSLNEFLLCTPIWILLYSLNTKITQFVPPENIPKCPTNRLEVMNFIGVYT